MERKPRSTWQKMSVWKKDEEIVPVVQGGWLTDHFCLGEKIATQAGTYLHVVYFNNKDNELQYVMPSGSVSQQFGLVFPYSPYTEWFLRTSSYLSRTVAVWLGSATMVYGKIVAWVEMKYSVLRHLMHVHNIMDTNSSECPLCVWPNIHHPI